MNRNDAQILLESTRGLADSILRARQMRLAESEEARRAAVEQRALDMASDRDAAMARYHDNVVRAHEQQVQAESATRALKNRLLQEQIAALPQAQAQEQAVLDMRRMELGEAAATRALKQKLLQAQLEALPKQNEQEQAMQALKMRMMEQQLQARVADPVPAANAPKSNGLDALLGAGLPQSVEDVDRSMLESRRNAALQNYAGYKQAGPLNWRNWMPFVDSTQEKMEAERDKIDEINEQLHAPVVQTQEDFEKHPAGTLINYNGKYIRKK